MSITIDAQRFEVKVTTEEIGGDGPRTILGQEDEATNTIVVDGTTPISRQEEILLHEFVHLAAPFLFESDVSAISNNLYGILRGNGLLVDNLMSRVSDGAPTAAQMASVNETSDQIAVMQGLARETAVSEAPAAEPRTYKKDQWDRAVLFKTDKDALLVREPDGRFSRVLAHSAAAILAGARGGIPGTKREKRRAARQLVTIYKDVLQEEPPRSLRALAR